MVFLRRVPRLTKDPSIGSSKKLFAIEAQTLAKNHYLYAINFTYSKTTEK
jgi:hypothetical protein